MFKEFKEFAVKGNMLDLAVAVILGAAFGAIVQSLVHDVIMPPIGLLLGRIDFNNLMVVLKEGTKGGPYSTPAAAAADHAVTINYGTFINLVITFLIVAWSVFFLIKAMNSVNRKQIEEPAAAPAPSNEEILLTEIRDLLAKKA